MALTQISLRCRGVVFVCELRDGSRLVGEICLSVASAVLAVGLRYVLPERLDIILDFALSFLLSLSIGCIILFPCLHIESVRCINTRRNRKHSGHHRGDRAESWVYERQDSEVPTWRTLRSTEMETDAVSMTLNDDEPRGSVEYAQVHASMGSYLSLARSGPSTSRRTSIASREERPPSQNFEVDEDLPSGPGESRIEMAPSASPTYNTC